MPDIKNVAIIMDGNGRWAKSKHRPRVWGHIRGAAVINDIVEESILLGINSLTLYTFSSENWSRPKAEISLLFKLLGKFLKKNLDVLHQKKVSFNMLGDYSFLSAQTLDLVKTAINQTSSYKTLKLNFAFNYGGRDEIVNAVNKFISEHPGERISKSDIANNLYDSAVPDMDLIVRTGGDLRLSNFLLWQSAYAELAFTPTKWPDFSREEFRSIIDFYKNRDRRFGGLGNENSLSITEAESSKQMKTFYDK